MKWWDLMPWSLFFDCWTLSHPFQSPVSPASRGSLVPLHFLSLKWYHLLSEVVDISRWNLNCILWVIQPALHIMHSEYNLNKQGDNIQPWSIPFPILNQPAIPLFHVLFYCCFLTCMQISQEAAKLVWYSHLFKNIPQVAVIHTVKGFSRVDEAKVDFFLEFPGFLYDSMDIGNVIICLLWIQPEYLEIFCSCTAEA